VIARLNHPYRERKCEEGQSKGGVMTRINIRIFQRF